MGTISITYQIPGTRLVDQLHEPTSDGMPDENKTDNCVAAANACFASAATGQPHNGDELKDKAYRQGYVGFMSEAKFVAVMAALGIKVTRAPASTQAGLLAIIHREVPRGHGVIITMPSQWNSAVIDPKTGRVRAGWNPRTYSGPSHVGLMCGVGKVIATGEAALRCMNPWDATVNGWHDGSDTYWGLRLVAGEVWILEYVGVGKVEVGAMVPSGWHDDGKTLVAPNGVAVVQGFRTWVLAHSWDAQNTPLKAEQVVSSGSIEPGNASIGPGSRQDFRFCSLGWTTKSNVYVIATGQDLLAIEGQLALAAKQIEALKAQLAAVPAPQPPDPKAQAALAALLALASGIKTVAP